jgi:GH15 family glucan-1,4-alpha-glucosidase
MPMAYQPIENYGIIGDLHSVALVGMDGSIDWLCLPHFDSPSVFAAILDDEKGGRFKIAPVSEDVTRKQFYWPDTNILITRFFTPDGVGEITDYMPIHMPENDHRRHQLVRRVKVVRGEMTSGWSVLRPSITLAMSTKPRSLKAACTSALRN